MLHFSPANIERELDRDHPLFVGNFFDLKGMWWTKRKQRQGLIISIAVAWYRLMRSNPTAAGFVEKETFLTHLTSQVKDARKALEAFFTITRIGYNFSNGLKNPSLISPKRLGKEMMPAIEGILNELMFSPGDEPIDKRLTKSPVHLKIESEAKILTLLKQQDREDLIPAVSWIIKQKSPITFYFQASGKLQARDTSVWPIRAIENWPGWLRYELFGTSIDIESAYSQFLLEHLNQKYAKQPHVLEMRYPVLLRMNHDKKSIREELLSMLKLENTKSNMKVVKQIFMSLANGSNASPALMVSGSYRCEAANLIREASPELLPTELVEIGRWLSKIVKQFVSARKDLCIHILKAKPTRANQKKIFRIYMEWEREARYKIWEAVGKTGLMLHDGIDGVISDKTDAELVDYVSKHTSIRVSSSIQSA